MRPIRLFGCAASAALITGCGSLLYTYALRPKPVVVNPADEPWQVEVIIDIKNAIDLEVVNRGQEPVKVLWDECAYVDIDGRSHRLRPAAEEPLGQLPTTVPPGSKLKEALLAVRGGSDNPDDPLLPGRPRTILLSRSVWDRFLRPFHRAQLFAAEAVGKNVSVYLVLEREGNRRSVTAAYAISGVHARRR